MSYLQEIRKLKESYQGEQDKDMQKNVERYRYDLEYLNSFDKYIGRREIQSKRDGDQLIYRVMLNEKELMRHLYVSDLENVESVCVSIGGAIIDKVYTKDMNVLRHLYDMGDDEIPMNVFKIGMRSCDQEIRISMRNRSSPPKVSFDVYKSLSEQKDKVLEYPVYLVRYRYTQNDQLNHPIFYIFYESDSTDSVSLSITSGRTKEEQVVQLVELSKTDSTDGYRIFPLTEDLTLNSFTSYGMNPSNADSLEISEGNRNIGKYVAIIGNVLRYSQ